MQADLAIGQNLGRRMASAGHQFALRIDLVVAHFDVSLHIHEGDQMPVEDAAAEVGASEEIALLLVVEAGVAVDLAIVGVGDGAEDFIVVIDHGMSDSTSCTFVRNMGSIFAPIQGFFYCQTLLMRAMRHGKRIQYHHHFQASSR